METWKDVKSFEGIYQINNLGIVRRISYPDSGNKGKYKVPYYLKSRKDKDGYLKYTLCNKEINKNFSSHRLVALHFIENPLNKKEVNHKNGVKDDNRVENLEWVTQSENRQHCLKYLNPKLRNNKLSKKTFQYDLQMNLINVFPSAKEAGRQTGIHQGHISECCRGEIKQANGFIWKYE
jgi:hypothetical protein